MEQRKGITLWLQTRTPSKILGIDVPRWKKENWRYNKRLDNLAESPWTFDPVVLKLRTTAISRQDCRYTPWEIKKRFVFKELCSHPKALLKVLQSHEYYEGDVNLYMFAQCGGRKKGGKSYGIELFWGGNFRLSYCAQILDEIWRTLPIGVQQYYNEYNIYSYVHRK